MLNKLLENPVADLSLRILAATIGGYALCWTLIDLLCRMLPFAKVTVWFLTGQLVPLPFLVTLLWAFIAKTPRHALAVPLSIAACTALPGVLS